MTRKIFFTSLLTDLLCNAGFGSHKKSVLLEAESFKNKGGWVIDQQSMDVMGSPYLMPHGMGNPVADAFTTVSFAEKGNYQIFVRIRNWTAPWSGNAAGRFQILIDGNPIDQEFGIGERDWSWVDGGTVKVSNLLMKIR